MNKDWIVVERVITVAMSQGTPATVTMRSDGFWGKLSIPDAALNASFTRTNLRADNRHLRRQLPFAVCEFVGGTVAVDGVDDVSLLPNGVNLRIRSRFDAAFVGALGVCREHFPDVPVTFKAEGENPSSLLRLVRLHGQPPARRRLFSRR